MTITTRRFPMYYDKDSSRPKPVVMLGRICVTANADAKLERKDIMDALDRHIRGDWGNVSDEDWLANDEALQCDDRLLSAYIAANGLTFWIITEWDRSLTTILLPEDY